MPRNTVGESPKRCVLFLYGQIGHVRRILKKVQAGSIGLTLQKSGNVGSFFYLPIDSVVLPRELEQHRDRFRSLYIRHGKVLNFALP